MKFLRWILLPFALIYGGITQVRNIFFDCGILPMKQFKIPVIVVGNLSVGGTGKSPMVEYLIRMLSSEHTLATLSRGYKRESKGFLLADQFTTVKDLGDEPYQYHKKFSDIHVAVDAQRVRGVEKLMSSIKNLDIVLLDDAYQHRYIKGSFYVLLTTFDDLFVDDFLLPVGTLRESRSGANRADVIVVTKCPENLTEESRDSIEKRLNRQYGKEVFFTTIGYEKVIVFENRTYPLEEFRLMSKVIVAGIAKPKPFIDYITNGTDVVLEFGDHHDFSDQDIQQIHDKSNEGYVVTTEKDFMRLSGRVDHCKWGYLAIRTKFLFDENRFQQLIYNHLKTFRG